MVQFTLPSQVGAIALESSLIQLRSIHERILQIVRLGGEQLLEASIELLLPFYFLRRTALYKKTKPFWLGLLSNVNLGIFVDAGLVQMVPRIWDETGKVSSDLIPSVSIGAGLRYKTRIGFIRVDFAYRVTEEFHRFRYPLQSRFKIHFAISQ